jgi:general secretion pathway protein E
MNTQQRLETVGRPLTSKGEEFELPETQQQMLCLLPNGDLLVSKTHIFNPAVTGFMGRLRRVEHPYEVKQVEMSVINQAYAGARDSNKDANSSNMMEAAQELFKTATQKSASDIHIRVSTITGTEIKFRIHGSLKHEQEQTYQYGDLLTTAIYQAMADQADSTYEKLNAQDARIGDRKKLPPGVDGIRIGTTPQTDGHVMVLRLLYNDTNNSLDPLSLGYTEEHAEAFSAMKMKPFGINVIAGPTGSGKSTTLQRILLSIVEETDGEKNVMTVEDPAEYSMRGVVQTSVPASDTEAGRSAAYQKSIKAILRLDPDVIMIGESRDAASARLAIQAAMTGHQVWTTLHANGAFAMLERLMEMGVQPDLVCDPTIVTGLACQRLVKILCPHCRKPLADVHGRYKKVDLDRVLKFVQLDKTNVIGDGCDKCNGTGTKGRTVVAEVLVTNETLMAHMRARNRLAAINHWRNKMGGKTMLEHAISKIREGLCDPFLVEREVGRLTDSVLDSDPMGSE